MDVLGAFSQALGGAIAGAQEAGQRQANLAMAQAEARTKTEEINYRRGLENRKLTMEADESAQQIAESKARVTELTKRGSREETLFGQQQDEWKLGKDLRDLQRQRAEMEAKAKADPERYKNELALIDKRIAEESAALDYTKRQRELALLPPAQRQLAELGIPRTNIAAWKAAEDADKKGAALSLATLSLAQDAHIAELRRSISGAAGKGGKTTAKAGATGIAGATGAMDAGDVSKAENDLTGTLLKLDEAYAASREKYMMALKDDPQQKSEMTKQLKADFDVLDTQKRELVKSLEFYRDQRKVGTDAGQLTGVQNEIAKKIAEVNSTVQTWEDALSGKDLRDVKEGAGVGVDIGPAVRRAGEIISPLAEKVSGAIGESIGKMARKASDLLSNAKLQPERAAEEHARAIGVPEDMVSVFAKKTTEERRAAESRIAIEKARQDSARMARIGQQRAEAAAARERFYASLTSKPAKEQERLIADRKKRLESWYKRTPAERAAYAARAGMTPGGEFQIDLPNAIP